MVFPTIWVCSGGASFLETFDTLYSVMKSRFDRRSVTIRLLCSGTVRAKPRFDMPMRGLHPPESLDFFEATRTQAIDELTSPTTGSTARFSAKGHRLKALRHDRCLGRRRVATGFEENIWLRKMDVLEKSARHLNSKC